jgi:3-phenylpropionate/trans-cinnamate dioxygenase ferredoxin component
MFDPQFVRICSTTDVTDGNVKSFAVGNVHLAIARSEGKWYAFADICSHEHEHLSEGWLEGDRIECPRHGAQFSMLTGEALTLPATEPVAVFPLEIRGEELWVGLPAEVV